MNLFATSSISWGTPLYILALYGLVRYFIRPTEKPHVKSNGWSPLEAVGITLFLYFIGQLIGGLLAYGVALAVGHDQAQAATWLSEAIVGQFVFIALVEAVTVGLLVWFLKRRRSNLQTLGLRGKPGIRDLGLALIAIVVYFVLYVIAVSILKNLVPSFNIDQQQQLGFHNPSHWQLPLIFISLVILPPMVEEILVRGFLYTGLRRKYPLIPSALITSGLFGLAHLEAGSGQPLLWIAALDTFVLSLVLVYLRERTGKLWAPMIVHGIKNTVAFLSLFVFHVVK